MWSSLKPQLSPQETVLCTFHVVSRGEWVPTADCCVGQDANMGVGGSGGAAGGGGMGVREGSSTFSGKGVMGFGNLGCSHR